MPFLVMFARLGGALRLLLVDNVLDKPVASVEARLGNSACLDQVSPFATGMVSETDRGVAPSGCPIEGSTPRVLKSDQTVPRMPRRSKPDLNCMCMLCRFSLKPPLSRSRGI